MINLLVTAYGNRVNKNTLKGNLTRPIIISFNDFITQIINIHCKTYVYIFDVMLFMLPKA